MNRDREESEVGISDDDSLDVLKLPPKIQNALESHGIFTWGDLLHVPCVGLASRGPASKGTRAARLADADPVWALPSGNV